MKNVSTTTTASEYADYNAGDGDPKVDPYAYAMIVSVGTNLAL